MPTKYIKTGFEDRVIRSDGFYKILLNGKEAGFNLDLRLNYYRGLPLSSVETLELTIDGKKIPETNMFAELNGKVFSIGHLKELFMEYWGIKSVMHLRVYNYNLAPGAHDVELTLLLRRPYMMFGPGEHGAIDSSASKQLTLAEGREI